MDNAMPALKKRSDALNKVISKFKNMSKSTELSQLSEEVDIAGVKGRISELHVRMALARESALIKCHERLLQELVRFISSEAPADALRVRSTELLQDMGMLKNEKPGSLSWWKRATFEACLYDAQAYELVNKEAVGTYIQDCQASPNTTAISEARIQTLLSLCSHGVHASEYEGWRKGCKFEKKYGHRARYLLGNLESAGLLKPRKSTIVSSGLTSPAYIELANNLGQLREGGGVYASWDPLACILADRGLQGEWNSIGRNISKAGPSWHHKGAPFSMNPRHSDGKTCSLVVFLGGCTESELAAIRGLSTDEHRFLVVTTGMISSTSFISAFRVDYEQA